MENPQKYNVASIQKQKQMLEIVSDVTQSFPIFPSSIIIFMLLQTVHKMAFHLNTLAKRCTPCNSYYVFRI